MKIQLQLMRFKETADADFLKAVAEAGLKPAYYIAFDDDSNVHILMSKSLNYRDVAHIRMSFEQLLDVKWNRRNMIAGIGDEDDQEEEDDEDEA